MAELLITILIVLLALALLISLGLVSSLDFRLLVSHFKCSALIGRFDFRELLRCFNFPVLPKVGLNEAAKPCEQPDPKVLNCRVQLIRQEKDNRVFDAFNVEIRGSIHAPGDRHYTTVQVLITDVTDGITEAKPVQARVEQWQQSPQTQKKAFASPQLYDSPAFCYNADLGRLPHAESILSDWTAVAQLDVTPMIFPRKGKRNLHFNISILSRENGEELACATCTFSYENASFGYIDLQENIQRTKTLAVALAFAVSAADKKLYDCEVELIKNWARGNIDVSKVSDKARRKFDKALDEALGFFLDGNQLDTYKICKEIAEIAPLAERCEILDLCLRVARANGSVAAEELAILKNLANWLEVDMNRFRAMAEKILPVGMHQVEDVEVTIGVNSNMSKEETRRHLNKEYRKWNARVTNFDPEIQTQADQMLKLIAEARSQYVG